VNEILPTAPAPAPSGSEPVLRARDLRVWYGTQDGDPVRAVDGVSFEIKPGETLGLVGESGCGKSTLGRGVLGLLPDSASVAGEVLYRDRELVGIPAKEMRAMRGPEVGLIFQEPMTRLNPLVTIENHFMETLKAHEPDLDKDEMQRRSLEALAGMGIPPTRFRQYPHEFSGGMRQRIMIALALVLNPKLLVADEPTTALDVIVEAQILGILADLRRNFDTALLLITHNLGIVAEACDRLAVMYAGRIVEEGDAREVFAEPAHPYTRELLRSIISLETTGLHYIPGAPPNLIDPPPGCRFHPRCPNAMRVCAEREPIEVPLAGGRRTECWLHGPADEIPPGGNEPLEREEIALAEEA
jgi:peptide/nickel transport system ATP-binding protein